MVTLSSILLYAVPAVIVICFVVSIIKYRTCPAESTKKKKFWKVMRQVFGWMTLVFVVILGGLFLLLMAMMASM